MFRISYFLALSFKPHVNDGAYDNDNCQVEHEVEVTDDENGEH